MSVIYQLRMWDEPEMLAVPKQALEGLTDWEQVSMAGWDNWLKFWSLTVPPNTPFEVPELDIVIQARAPRPVERAVFAKLERETARKVGKPRDVELVHRQIIALEKHFMEHYERRDFKLRYHEFIQRCIPTKANLEITHRYLWIADRMSMYTTNADGRSVPDVVSVVKYLDVASWRMQYILNAGGDVDLTVDISHLLNVRVRKIAA